MWLIARREFLERVRQRAFVFALVIGAVVSIAAVTLPPLLTDDGSGSDATKIGVTAPQPAASVAALQAVQGAGDAGGLELRAVADEGALRGLVSDGEIPLGLVLGGTPSAPQLTLVSREDGGGIAATAARHLVQRATVVARAQDGGVSAREAAALVAPIDAEISVVRGAGPTAEAASVAFVLTLVVYIAIILLVTALATGLVADRSSRVTERLLAAASPRDHLLGKLIGVGSSGVLQLGAWFGAALAADAVASGSGADNILGAVPTELLLFFPFSLLGAYVLYSAISVLLVMPVRKPEDVGGAITPTTVLTIVAFVLATTVIAPGATVSPSIATLSLIPFFSPLLMLARLAGDDVALWEFAVAALGPFVLGGLFLAWMAPVYARNALDPASGKGLAGVHAALRR